MSFEGEDAKFQARRWRRRDAHVRRLGLLGAHLDGQLDPVKTLEVEGHIATCEVCRERLALDRALRGSLKKAVKTTAPSDVRARMLAAMAGETAARRRARKAIPKARGRTSAHDESRARRVRRTPQLARPSAVDAPSLAHDASARERRGSRDGVGRSRQAAGRARHAGHDGARRPQRRSPRASFVGAAHASAAAASSRIRSRSRSSSATSACRFASRSSEAPNARFVGGRLLPVQGGERAAMLQYEVQARRRRRPARHRLRLRPAQDPGRATRSSPPRAVGTAEVRVGRTDGYSVAVTQHGGVGYTIASDMDPRARRASSRSPSSDDQPRNAGAEADR